MIDKSYIAGFFDGEGCVYVQEHKRRGRSKRITQRASGIDIEIRVTIANTDRRPLDEIRKQYGGSVCVNPSSGNRKTQYTLHIAGQKTLAFMLDVVDLTIIKREKLLKAIAFKQYLNTRRRNHVVGYQGSYVSKEQWAKRRKAVELVRDVDVPLLQLVGFLDGDDIALEDVL